MTFWVTPDSKSSLAGACKLLIIFMLDWSALDDDFRTFLTYSGAFEALEFAQI